MPHARIYKTSFAGGEIAPQLLGRGDLRAYDNGARRLRNVFIHPTGGISRRHGLRFVDFAPGTGRLIAFEFNTEQVYLLVFSDRCIDVYRQGTRVARLEAPWTADQLTQINWTQSADTLLVVHPDVPPRKITRTTGEVWTLSGWTFETVSNRIHVPHQKFAAPAVTLTPSATSGTISLTASAPVFGQGHVGTRFRIVNKEVEILSAGVGGVNATALCREVLASTAATVDWTEQAFSPVHGWPVSVCFHQDRLVIGGSRDLPNRLWLSKSADLFSFDLAEGRDDEAIEFPILSDQVNAIRHVFSGRHLQIFTSGAEWMVTGDPLTPTSIQLFRQTRVGSRIDRTIPPQDVDGATLFVPRAGPQLREFLFADSEQAYQATDLAMLAHHLIDRAVDMAYDEPRRLLHVVMANGTMATLTVYRDEEVSGWTQQSTSGLILAVANVGEETYVMVDREGSISIEAFDETFHVDCGLAGTAVPAKSQWSGADHLEGRTVKVVADGALAGDQVVENGGIKLDHPASAVQLGLAFTHIVEPLPPSGQTLAAGQAGRLRPISLTLRVWETRALQLDTGRGLVHVPFARFGGSILDAPPQPYSGDVTVRTLGWRDAGIEPLWRIEQDTPLAFTLLSASTEIGLAG